MAMTGATRAAVLACVALLLAWTLAASSGRWSEFQWSSPLAGRPRHAQAKRPAATLHGLDAHRVTTGGPRRTTGAGQPLSPRPASSPVGALERARPTTAPIITTAKVVEVKNSEVAAIETTTALSTTATASQSVTTTDSATTTAPLTATTILEEANKTTNASSSVLAEHFDGAAQAACLAKAGFELREKKDSLKLGTLLSVVTWKGDQPEGFPAMADWVIGLRAAHGGWIPKNTSYFGDPTKPPKFIFLQSDNTEPFIENILPCLSRKVVVMIGDGDKTVPRQIDLRYGPLITMEQWDRLLAHPLVAHVWACHLDVAPSKKASLLPVGLNPINFDFENHDWDWLLKEMNKPPGNLLQRQLKVLQIDRVRSEAQWDTRKKIAELCVTTWSSFCQAAQMDHASFHGFLKQFSFLICGQGGGLDPNPKAFTALALGVIPIIKKFESDFMYRDMPVIIVDDWTEDALSVEKLEKWRKEFAPFFEDPVKWSKVEERVSTAFWKKLVEQSWETGRGFGYTGE